MKLSLCKIILPLLLCFSAACADGYGENRYTNGSTAMIDIKITVGSSIFTAKLPDTSSARAFAAQLPMTITMEDLNANEKYCTMENRFPVNAVHQGSIKSGDIMLYGNNCLVLFYQGFQSSYTYTKLGSIDDAHGLASALGSGRVRVDWELVP